MKKIILKYSWLTKIALWIHKSIVLNKTVTIGKNVSYTLSTVFEGYNTIGRNSEIINSSIGLCSYISEYSRVKNTKIGRFCSIGPDFHTIFGNHPTSKFVSTHPAFFSTRKQAGISFVTENTFEEFSEPLESNSSYSISIGNDVWIGAKVSILDGIKIGDGAVIAAGSVVVKDVKPYEIVGGVPAKTIKNRFNKQIINDLLNTQWWNFEINDLKASVENFQNIDTFLNKIKSKN